MSDIGPSWSSCFTMFSEKPSAAEASESVYMRERDKGHISCSIIILCLHCFKNHNIREILCSKDRFKTFYLSVIYLFYFQVFLQHLSPLLSLSTFTALWLTILDFMDKYMHVDRSDLLVSILELFNMHTHFEADN